MSAGLASDEVAEDYKNSLEDLTGNDKFQISNLTVIAKENTEHAMAISRVLENHIRTTPPAQKLPALYVVDSVVKNVGTPYTLFLGRNLYQTFMNAYTLVDSQTRKKLDEMLKTWKEPVPGSLDTRPVFPAEITRSIENALIKARTAALQQQQTRPQEKLGRARGTATPPGPWRNTPTPPQAAPHHPTMNHRDSQYGTNGQSHGNHTPQPEPYSRYGQPQAYSQPRQDSIDLGVLHRDIENLIATARSDFAANPLDTSVQQRLKALLDLQSILQRQQLPQDQLKLIREQVSQLAPPPKPAPQPTPSQQQPAPTPPVATPPTNPASNASFPPNIQSLLNSNTLADLIKATANRQRPTPPPQSQQAFPVPQPSTSQAAAPATSENPLIASLRARGLLPPPTAAPAAPEIPHLPFILPGQAGFNPVQASQSNPPASTSVQLTSTSIRIPRPNLISSLYEARSNRCGTCGRRFLATEEGKEKKARHLDWHFKTNQRMAEAAKRGQNRSWYVDERDWISSREYDDDSGPTDSGPSTNKDSSEGGSSKNAKQKQWIRAPNDATLRNTPCPICQEKFESTWSEEAQDWIWQDATKVGNRIYHASCYSEVTKGGPGPGASAGAATTVGTGTPGTGQGTPAGRTGTPDSVLGKRKAEESDYSPGLNVRIKTEPVS
ncbi:hypothetical protein FQN54_005834 [Arachnomyces sp. PD_36]|nr:hypothetical protein FQN54_005834 [Arachnomyces sp. PD_36]